MDDDGKITEKHILIALCVQWEAERKILSSAVFTARLLKKSSRYETLLHLEFTSISLYYSGKAFFTLKVQCNNNSAIVQPRK